MALGLVVLISGTGSNLRAILRAIDERRCAASVLAVLSDRGSAEGLALAIDRGIPTEIVKLSQHNDRAEWDRALAERVASYEPDLVVLAGFMKIVGAHMLRTFKDRILNVHPALLPAFPGSDAPAQAITAGVRISGCTVHRVDSGVDTGPIVAQAAVPVLASDDAARLHLRIQRAEHHLLPAVIDALARGQISLTPAATADERTRSAHDNASGADDTATLISPVLAHLQGGTLS